MSDEQRRLAEIHGTLVTVLGDMVERVLPKGTGYVLVAFKIPDPSLHYRQDLGGAAQSNCGPLMPLVLAQALQEMCYPERLVEFAAELQADLSDDKAKPC